MRSVLAVGLVGVVLFTSGCRKKPPGSSGGATTTEKPGSVVCWGLGRSGQIGNAKNDDHNKPSSVIGLDGATKLHLGSIMSCATVASGTQCWGDLRIGEPTNVPRPFEIVPDLDTIESSTLFSCALAHSGKVSCWGSNLVGQLGNGKAPDPKTPVKIAIKGAKGGGLDIQPASPMPLSSDSKTPVDVSGLTDATAIAVGGSHTCALRRDTTVVCWGSNSAGQLGDGNGGYNKSSDHPIVVPALTGVVAIASGKRATCARTADSLLCWGTFSDEYPSDPSQKPVLLPSPTKIEGLTNVVELAISDTTACARTTAAEIKCWGASGKTETKSLKKVAQITAGATHFCARLESGTATCWGDDGFQGKLGTAENDHAANAPVDGVTNAIDIAAGSSHTCVIRK